MKKKNYEKPQVKTIEVKQADIICTSPTLQNERYIEENDVTNDWFNY